MAMVEFGDYYINPKHVSCIGIKERCLCGRVSGAKYWYEVFVICCNQKIATSCQTRRDAEELVQQIKLYAS